MTADASRAFQPLISVDACRVWLATLPAADPLAAVNAIAAEIEELPDRGGMDALRVLEFLRTPVLQLLEALSTRHADKLLPLSPQQATSLSSVTALSRALAEALADGVSRCMADKGEYGKLAALVHQRAIFWVVQAMAENLRARQRVPDDLWNVAQNMLLSAGRAGLIDQPVRDSLLAEGRTTVGATYVRAVLLHLCGARSLAPRELDYARQLAVAFERKVVMAFHETDGGRETGGNPAAAASARARTVRIGRLEHTLDVAALAKSVGGRLTELNQGNMFETPALLPAPTTAVLRPLFAKLYGAWCARANMRRFPRRTRSEVIFFAIDPELMYGLMKRRPYFPPPPPKLYKHVEVANIYVDGSAASMKDQSHTPESWQQVLGLLDCWQLLEESATGLSMQRGVHSGKARVRRGQLAAIRLGAEGTAMVCEIRWAEQTSDGRLEIGVEILPGLARAGAVRYADASSIMQATGGKSPSTAALIMDNFRRAKTGQRDAPAHDTGVPTGPSNPLGLPTALPSIDEAMLNKTGALAPLRGYTEQATLLLPAGWAREGSVVEFIDGPTALRLRLRGIASRHGEFERMHFEFAQ